MASCGAELCRRWTGTGCICQVLDLDPQIACEDHPDFDADDCPLCPDDEWTDEDADRPRCEADIEDGQAVCLTRLSTWESDCPNANRHTVRHASA